VTQCNEISPLLGAFGDGELKPHQMQEVARHLAKCQSCEAELAETSALGMQLRANAIEPDLTGFALGVQQRIAKLTPPFHIRLRRYLESARERLTTGLALGAAALATAALTAVLLSPYASQLALGRHASQVAGESAVPGASETSGSELAAAAADSEAVIASVESHVPSVAVWSAPENHTAVIWIPDQR
jgi:anti-sigma factor RsiW